MSDKTKQASRTLQARTGWKYQTCRRLVEWAGPDKIEYLTIEALSEVLASGELDRPAAPVMRLR